MSEEYGPCDTHRRLGLADDLDTGSLEPRNKVAWAQVDGGASFSGGETCRKNSRG